MDKPTLYREIDALRSKVSDLLETAKGVVLTLREIDKTLEDFPDEDNVIEDE